jgi:uncharacterized protein (TIGR00725 family)
VTRSAQIAVVGGGRGDPDVERLAEAVGAGLARAGATVVCGGLGGVMEAAARGAASEEGVVIGIVPGESRRDANPHCTHVVATGIGHARNLAVVASADAVIAIGGEWGTLSEIAFARRIGRPVVGLESWSVRAPRAAAAPAAIESVDDPETAVTAALEAARTGAAVTGTAE